MATIQGLTDSGDLGGHGRHSYGKGIVWSSVTNADTCAEAFFQGGKATIEVNGTFNGATVQINWGSTSGTNQATDTNAAPSGHKFTAAGEANIQIAAGYLQPVISGGGASQSLKILVRPIPL